MEIDYLTPLSNVCSETSIQQKRLHTSVNNVVLFSVMETDYSTPLITVCSETSIQKKRLHTSVNNVVPFSSYVDRYHFSEQCGTLFQLWGHITQPL